MTVRAIVRPIVRTIARPVAGGLANPVSVSGTLPTGSTSSAYSSSLTASGGTTPYTWTLQSGSLPPGLALNASTGVVSGTPTVAQVANYAFTLRVTDAASTFADSAQSVHISGLGAELLTNGAFAADTNWTKGTGWTILGGVASFAGGGGGAVMSQAISGSSSVTYEITYTVLTFTAGQVTAELVGGTTVSGTARVANGTYTQQLTAPATFATFQFNGAVSSGLDVDNASLRQVIA